MVWNPNEFCMLLDLYIFNECDEMCRTLQMPEFVYLLKTDAIWSFPCQSNVKSGIWLHVTFLHKYWSVRLKSARICDIFFCKVTEVSCLERFTNWLLIQCWIGCTFEVKLVLLSETLRRSFVIQWKKRFYWDVISRLEELSSPILQRQLNAVRPIQYDKSTNHAYFSLRSINISIKSLEFVLKI